MSNEEFEVEHLLDHRPSERSPGTIEYFIKWRGFSKTSNTWEREVNVFAKDLIVDYWKHQKISKQEYLKEIRSIKKRNLLEAEGSMNKTKKLKKHHTDNNDNNEDKDDEDADQEEEEGEEDSPPRRYSFSAELSVEPPNALNWRDLKKIINVYHSERTGLFSEVKWSNNTTSFIPNLLIREYQPAVLIRYYETRLEFRA